MKKLLTGITLFALLFATAGISNQAFAQTDKTNPDVSCEEAKKNLADLMSRYDAIKRKIYSEWQQAHDAGRYTGSWEQYAKENLDALPDVQELHKLQERYNNVIRQCTPTDKTRPQSTDSRPADKTVCREVYDIKKKLADSETRYGEIKTKFYNEWKRLHDSGDYSGDWSQYAEEKFIKSTEIQEIQKLRERYNNLVSQCQNARPSSDKPVANDNVKPDKSNVKPDKSDLKPMSDTNHDELQKLKEENQKLKHEIERLKAIIQEQLSVIMDILSKMKSNLG